MKWDFLQKCSINTYGIYITYNCFWNLNILNDNIWNVSYALYHFWRNAQIIMDWKWLQKRHPSFKLYCFTVEKLILFWKLKPPRKIMRPPFRYFFFPPVAYFYVCVSLSFNLLFFLVDLTSRAHIKMECEMSICHFLLKMSRSRR